MSIINSIDILPPKFPEYLDEAVKRGKLTEALRNDEEWIKEYGVNMKSRKKLLKNLLFGLVRKERKMSVLQDIDIILHDEERYLNEAVDRGFIDEKVLQDRDWLKDFDTWINFEFSDSTRNVCNLFVRLLKEKKYRTPETFWLQLVPVWQRYYYSEDPKGKAVIQVLFDYFKYRSLPDTEKQRMILEAIMDGARWLAPRAGWDIQPFEDVYRQIIELNFKNEYVFRQLTNPTRRYRASIRCVHDMYSTKVYMALHRREKEYVLVIEKQIVDTSPGEWDFYMFLGKLKWLSPESVRLAYRGYRGYSSCFREDQVSGLVFDFTDVIEKFELGASWDIREEDIDMRYLCGPQDDWGEPLTEKPVEKPVVIDYDNDSIVRKADEDIEGLSLSNRGVKRKRYT